MQVALTPRQARFVEEFVLCGNAAEAARRAGYSAGSAKVTACRMLTKANLQAAIAAKKQAVAEETELRKEHVIAAVLEAIRLAKEQVNPAAMIRGLVEVAKMLGYYDPDRVKVELSDDSKRLQAKFEAMSDEELLSIISRGSQ